MARSGGERRQFRGAARHEFIALRPERRRQVIVMHRGKVLADSTPRKLVAAAGVATVEEAFLAMHDP